jgi:di/tricarboxylate transporter
LVGTSPNVIVSRLREDIVGHSFHFLDFAYVGLPIAAAGWLYLVLAYRLLPAYRPKASAETEILDEIGYTTEVVVPADSAHVGQPVGSLLAAGQDDVAIVRLLRGDNKLISSPSTQLIKPDDKLILHGSSRALQLIIGKGGLDIARANRLKPQGGNGAEPVTAEAIVTPNSTMLDWSLSQLRVTDRFNINIIAINRGRQAITQRLKQVRFQPGDVVLVQGYEADVANAIQQLGLLPLAGRNLAIGKRKRQFYPLAVMAAAIVAMVSGLAPVSVAFLFAAVAMILLKCLTLREAYAALDPALLVTFAALVPLSHAIETTGTATVIATWLAYISQSLPVSGAIASIILLAMIVTPFLNNAATVLVLAPVAVETARRLGIPADAALMAVAIGAASDFLTPIGHQCNMLVMGPGGYRFADYPRLGLPLSILVVLLATPLIGYFWT